MRLYVSSHATMPEIARLLDALKTRLRAAGVTYAKVAESLGVSESSVKRMFSSGNLTLERLGRICALADTSIGELAQEASAAAPRLRQLTRAQEAQLVADPRLLLVAVCTANHLPSTTILSDYALDEAELVRHLATLDRMGIIELLPGNRTRLKIARDFEWLPDGPIAQFFHTALRDDFLDPRSRERSEWFLHGLFTEAAQAQVRERLTALRDEFAHLHEASRRAGVDQRFGQALFIALAPWEPGLFRALRRMPLER